MSANIRDKSVLSGLTIFFFSLQYSYTVGNFLKESMFSPSSNLMSMKSKMQLRVQFCPIATEQKTCPGSRGPFSLCWAIFFFSLDRKGCDVRNRVQGAGLRAQGQGQAMVSCLIGDAVLFWRCGSAGC
ncbi:hypothetical protein QBC38DRAFT_126556 [Podospora fimiseda]|uniref:Uncharacterized protein n=1 Tax=Podospora fimiseda TaxID=252190 RepID=A0AAN7BT95_9PEZI|nr:hypothetical protein QBC38DRAFT_126556 [Podospora fimiseda]